MATSDHRTKRRRLSGDDVALRVNKAGQPARTENGNGAVRSVQKHTDNQNSLSRAFVGELYKSNTFKIQVDELLDQVRPDLSAVEQAIVTELRDLKQIIETIPDHGPETIADAIKRLTRSGNLSIPFPQAMPGLDGNYKLKYLKPVDINMVGSYPLGLMTNSEDTAVIDVAVTMPRAAFQEKDYLNCRYLCKRAYYLSCIAAKLQSSFRGSHQCFYEYLNGNEYLPVLIIGSANTQASWNFRVMPVLEENTFSIDKLHPSKCCIRSKTKTNTDAGGSTPFYNGSIVADTRTTSYLKLRSESLQACSAYRDACFLGQTWLRQRGFGSEIERGGFGNFEWSVMTALLLVGGGVKNTPLFSLGYSSYQLFKAMLQYLANRDLIKSPQIIGASHFSIPVLDCPQFFDAERNHNLLFKARAWSFKLLQFEAKVSVSALGEATVDQFQPTFVFRTDLCSCRYDAEIDVELPTTHWNTTLDKIYKVLDFGLDNRTKAINLHFETVEKWSIQSDPIKRKPKVTIGFLFDPTNIYRTVDHGPSAEAKKEAAEFRRFWGEKAELRRFKDGSILESVVWSSNSATSVFQQLVSHCLGRHFGTDMGITFREDQTSNYLPWSQPQSLNAAFQSPIMKVQELEQEIRSLEGLPLHLRQLSSADPRLSYSSLKLPDAKDGRPINVIIQFEGSGRWPDDMEAIQRTKIAFLLKLGELLSESSIIPDLLCRVGLENEENSLRNQSFLDITYSTGLEFRLRIHHDREAPLLERQLNAKGQPPREKLKFALALAYYKQNFIRQPQHTQAIQSLAIKHPSFTQTVRLVRKWFANHLLSPHFSSNLIELFVAKVYTNPYPWAAPATGTVGLSRTLVMLGRWDWKHEPWIVNLGSEEMAEADVSAVQTRFDAWRKLDPAMNRVVIFAASNVDGDGATWTDNANPPKVVAARMSALARSATEVIKAQKSKVEMDIIFASNLSDYDFTILLDDDFDRGNRSLPSSFKNIQLQAASDKAIAGFDPISGFIDEVTNIYGDSVLFFYDEERRDVLAGLWNPQIRRTWKTKLGYSSMPINVLRAGDAGSSAGRDDVDINRGAILNEICRLGGALIKGIHKK